jgi:hypothetical protein
MLGFLLLGAGGVSHGGGGGRGGVVGDVCSLAATKGGRGATSFRLAALTILLRPCGARFLFEPLSVHGTVDVEDVGGTTRALLGRRTLDALTILRPSDVHP